MSKSKFSKEQESILRRLRDDAVFFAKVIMNFTPYSYQRDLLRTKAKRIVAVWGRQSGKTTCIAVKVIHYVYTRANRTVIIVSKGLRQSMIMFSCISNFILGNPILRRSVVRYTRTQIHLKNGSRIIALPCSADGANLRGHTADMVIMDEAAFMNETVITQVIFPMIATKKHGVAIMLSTPWGRNHIFYRSYTNPNFWVQRVKSRECPNITEEFLNEQRQLIGNLRFQIEYEAEFIEDQNALFTQDIIRGCTEIYEGELYTDEQLAKLTAQLGERYYIGVDLGKRFDHSVIKILRYQPIKVLDDEGNETVIAPAFKLVYSKQFPLRTKLSKVMEHIAWLHTRFNIVAGCIDETGVGQAVVEKISEMFPYIDGVWFTAQMKQQVAMYLYTRMEQRRVAFPHDQDAQRVNADYELCTQMNEQKYYYGRARERVEVEEKGVMLFEHPEGRHDDQLWAFALAVYATKERRIDEGTVIR